MEGGAIGGMRAGEQTSAVPQLRRREGWPAGTGRLRGSSPLVPVVQTTDLRELDDVACFGGRTVYSTWMPMTRFGHSWCAGRVRWLSTRS